MANFVVQQIVGEDPLSEEETRKAYAAAMAVFTRAHMPPVRAIAAQAEVERRDGAGLPESRLPQTVRQRFDVLSEAERAAGAAIGRARVSLQVASGAPRSASTEENENGDPVG